MEKNIYVSSTNLRAATISATKKALAGNAGWKKIERLNMIEFAVEEALKRVFEQHGCKVDTVWSDSHE